MKAIQLTGYKGFESMQLFEVEKPKPAANEVLLEVKAAGVNFAELELTKGRYRIPKEPPFIMGFEAAGVVVELGARVKNLKVGDRITSLVSTGGYAEYAVADYGRTFPFCTVKNSRVLSKCGALSKAPPSLSWTSYV